MIIDLGITLDDFHYTIVWSHYTAKACMTHFTHINYGRYPYYLIADKEI